MALATDNAGGSGRASQGAESYLTVRRAPRSEKITLGAVHRRPQQEAGEMCGLEFMFSPYVYYTGAIRRSLSSGTSGGDCAVLDTDPR
jgi:hypothetical protein